MAALSRIFQFLGLVIVPMALFYYIFNRGRTSDSKLMFGELSILALGAIIFLLGRALDRG